MVLEPLELVREGDEVVVRDLRSGQVAVISVAEFALICLRHFRWIQ